MHKTVQNLIKIQKEIQSKINELNYKDYLPEIIAISKTFKMDHISHLIEYGHKHFGENKVQEAVEKWSNIKLKNKNLILHMVGTLQTNKVKYAIKLFDYIHSVDNLKLAKKISDEQKIHNKKPKIFIQINLGNEVQKSGIIKSDLNDFYSSCKELDLDVVGTMCLPPEGEDSMLYFKELNELNQSTDLKEISMGMSGDFLKALEFRSTFLRIGSKIFGERS